MGFLAGKRAVIIGLASNRSIAWGIAQAMRREGADLAFSYQTDKLKGRVEDMASELGSSIVLPLDVADDSQIDAFFAGLSAHWDGFDVLVHSVAFAPADQLEGRYLDSVSREGFRVAHDVSSYSLAALAKKSEPLMQGRAGALLTLSYLGAVRTLPNYNVMGLAKASLEANVRFLAADLGASGIRINAISAGPMRTLAGAGIGDARTMFNYHQSHAPLRRTISLEEVGGAGLYLLSPLSGGVTGEIHYVDSGYNIISMPRPEDLKAV